MAVAVSHLPSHYIELLSQLNLCPKSQRRRSGHLLFADPAFTDCIASTGLPNILIILSFPPIEIPRTSSLRASVVDHLPPLDENSHLSPSAFTSLSPPPYHQYLKPTDSSPQPSPTSVSSPSPKLRKVFSVDSFSPPRHSRGASASSTGDENSSSIPEARRVQQQCRAGYSQFFRPTPLPRSPRTGRCARPFLCKWSCVNGAVG